MKKERYVRGRSPATALGSGDVEIKEPFTAQLIESWISAHFVLVPVDSIAVVDFPSTVTQGHEYVLVFQGLL